MRMIEGVCLVLTVIAISGCNITINGGATGVQGSGVSKSESRDVEEFHAIDLEGVGSLTVDVGQETAVSVTADDNLLPLIETKVVKGVLTIRPTESISTKSKLTFKIATPSLDDLTISGAGSATLSNASGENLSVSINGAGSVDGSGDVAALEIEIDGTGSVDFKDLKTKTSRIQVSGAGNATIHATESVDAEVNGVGSVTVHGNPADIKKQINGIGSVKKASK